MPWLSSDGTRGIVPRNYSSACGIRAVRHGVTCVPSLARLRGGRLQRLPGSREFQGSQRVRRPIHLTAEVSLFGLKCACRPQHLAACGASLESSPAALQGAQGKDRQIMVNLRSAVLAAVFAVTSATAYAQAPYGQPVPGPSMAPYGGAAPSYGGAGPAIGGGYPVAQPGGYGMEYGGYPDASPIPGAGIESPVGAGSAGAYSASVTEQLYSFDAPEPWLHGYFQEIPAYGGWAHFRPYNYRHVLSQSQAAGGWGMSPQMPYSHQFWHRYQERATMSNEVPAYGREQAAAGYAAPPQTGGIRQTATQQAAGYGYEAEAAAYGARQRAYGGPANRAVQPQQGYQPARTGNSVSPYRRNPNFR